MAVATFGKRNLPLDWRESDSRECKDLEEPFANTTKVPCS